MGGGESKPWREVSRLPNPAAWTPSKASGGSQPCRRQDLCVSLHLKLQLHSCKASSLFWVEKELRDICMKGPEHDREIGQHQVQILMFGSTQNGKSSLVNSLLIALKNKVSQYVLASTSETTATRSLYSPDIKVNKEPLKFRLMDMPGIFTGMGTHVETYVNAVLDGHINEDVVVPDGELDEKASYYTKDPEIWQHPCLVVLVMKAGKILEPETIKRFNVVKKAIEEIRLKVAVVLTHVDNLEGAQRMSLSAKNVANIYHDEQIRKAVEQASQDTGIPMGYIHPVVNYSHQVETSTEMNILHLYTLSKILDLAAEGMNSRRLPERLLSKAVSRN